MRWDEYRQYFTSQPLELAQERWDLYLHGGERIAVRGVQLADDSRLMYGRRVFIANTEERGTVENASHGFFNVLVDGKEGGETIKRRGYELLVADAEDRIRLGKLGESDVEQRRATPRLAPRQPTGVDIADRLWSQKRLGVAWVCGAGQEHQQLEPCQETSSIVVDSWGGQWDSATGLPHFPAKQKDTAGYSYRREAVPLSSPTPSPLQAILQAQAGCPAGVEPPEAPGAAYTVDKGKMYLVNGRRRISDGKTWRCEHYRQPSQCQLCGGAGVCEHGRRRSACLDCNKDDSSSNLWRGHAHNLQLYKDYDIQRAGS